MQQIIDALDVGGARELPGSAHSMAGCLLLFLSALIEPVIPVPLHPRAMDCCHQPMLCKQVYTQLHPSHTSPFSHFTLLTLHPSHTVTASPLSPSTPLVAAEFVESSPENLHFPHLLHEETPGSLRVQWPRPQTAR